MHSTEDSTPDYEELVLTAMELENLPEDHPDLDEFEQNVQEWMELLPMLPDLDQNLELILRSEEKSAKSEAARRLQEDLGMAVQDSRADLLDFLDQFDSDLND